MDEQGVMLLSKEPLGTLALARRTLLGAGQQAAQKATTIKARTGTGSSVIECLSLCGRCKVRILGRVSPNTLK